MGWLVGSALRTLAFYNRLTTVPAFRKKCQSPRDTQWAFLKALLEKHQDTDFGREHRFSEIQTIKDYQEKVPIRSWDDLNPYMEKVYKGNHQTLFPPNEPILLFAESSGTSGKPKYIPITETAYRLWTKVWSIYWGIFLKVVPKAFYGKLLYFPGDPEEGYIGKIPYGAISARVYKQQNFLIRDGTYPYPYTISKIKDYDIRYYTIMRVAVEQNVTFIPMANPSMVLTLFRVARDRREEIIEDVRSGNLRYADQIPEVVKAPLRKKLRPNPKRARQLEEIYKRTGDFLPRDYWPRLVSINCFTSGAVRLYFPELRKFINKEKVKIIDCGLLASEGRLSIPIPETGCCCPTIETNFFEFIPEDQIGSPNQEALTLDEIETGKRYLMIITNSSGLYRYNMGDIFEVSGFYEKVPIIKFCNKGDQLSSITGEKITEFQVTESVRIACEKIDFNLEDFIVCLHWDKNMPHYSLVTPNDGPNDNQLLKKLTDQVEEGLMQINSEYLSKRKSMRLGPLTLKIVVGDSYENYINNCKKRCPHMAQYKHKFLIGDPEFEKRFEFSHQIASTVDPKEI